MINVIVDLQLMFYKMAFVNSYKTDGFLYKESHGKVLVKSVFDYVMSGLSFMRSKERVVFVTDSRGDTWRSFIEKDSQYKKNRDKDFKFNIDQFFVCLEDFTKIISDAGLYHLSVSGAEGDDLIYMVSRAMYTAGMKVVIMSEDSDLLQLLRESSSAFVVMYRGNDWAVSNTYSRSGGPVDDLDWLKPDQITDLVGENPMRVNSVHIALIKIMSGDKGDNVKSSYFYDRSGKETSFTELRAKQAIENMERSAGVALTQKYLSQLWESEDERINLAKNMFLAVGKNSTNHVAVAENIKRNMRYVWLDARAYDEWVAKDMQSACEALLLDKEAYKRQRVALDNLHGGIFDGTKYEH
jgi:5'-3' exonuclease